MQPDDTASVATINVFSKDNAVHTVEPILISRKGKMYSLPDTAEAGNLVLQLRKMNGATIEIGVNERVSPLQFVTLKVYKFPFISLLSAGTLIMVVGLIISTVNRMNRTLSVTVTEKLPNPKKDMLWETINEYS